MVDQKTKAIHECPQLFYYTANKQIPINERLPVSYIHTVAQCKEADVSCLNIHGMTHLVLKGTA